VSHYNVCNTELLVAASVVSTALVLYTTHFTSVPVKLDTATAVLYVCHMNWHFAVSDDS